MSEKTKRFQFHLRGDIAAARKGYEDRAAIQAEGAAAKLWRASIGLSRRELAEITGYSERTIGAYEAGQFDADKPVTARALRSYRLACAAVALGVEFDWMSATLNLGPAVLTVPSKPRHGAAPAAPAGPQATDDDSEEG